MIILMLKMKKIGVISANKRGKPWKDMSWVITCSCSRFGETSCLESIMFFLNMDDLLIKEARDYVDMTCIL